MANMFEGMPFSEILDNLTYYSGDNRIIMQKIKDAGYKISMRSLQQYRSSQCVPSIQTANLIISALNEKIPLEVIKESLELEKEKQAEYKIGKIEKHISLYEHEFKDIANGETGYVSDIIEQRVNELYPNKRRAFSLYVKDLIEADIIKNVIEK